MITNRIITEAEFRLKLQEFLIGCPAKWVTGPGRSGAIAAVYASYLLKIPYVPYGCTPHIYSGYPVLVIDTARNTGRTMRKAIRRYLAYSPIECVLFEEPPRVRFWYEKEL